MRLLLLLALLAAVLPASAQDTTLAVASPSGTLRLTFALKDGRPVYRLDRLNRPVLTESALGLTLRDGNLGPGRDPGADPRLHLTASATRDVDETWEQVWGEERFVRNRYRELSVMLEREARAGGGVQRLGIVFRVYDDGLGFRYQLPDTREMVVMDEATEFRFPTEPTAWWFAAYQDNRYEYLYQKTPLGQITVAHTPLTMETPEGLYLSLHEASLVDFPSMALNRIGTTALKADLVPWSDGVRAYVSGPFETPWRTLLVEDTPGGLVTNYLVLNLNAPNQLVDTSWIEPGKYVGVWWEMHLDQSSWGPGSKHGATTANTRRYIDFAARHGFRGVLVEGWNTGWDQAWWAGEGYKFNFTEPYPDFDINALSSYARSKNVRLIGHHETGAITDNYERQMDSAYAFSARYGMNAVKTGYVGSRLRTSPNGPDPNRVEWHHGQFGVRHYQRTVESAARHRIMLDIHEPIKDTGLRRTWPNLMTREGARGMEYDAWSGDGGNPPGYHATLPFTRSLAGPFDYTPGVVRLFYPERRPNNRVNMTQAKGLALYVTIYSPLHMIADLPENLEGHPAMRWLEAVPTDWETTRVLHGDIGHYATIVRKDRRSDDWYLGSITDETGRVLEASLSFLDPAKTYVAEAYEDDPAMGDWRTEAGANALRTSERIVRSTDAWTLRLAPGGGAAIRFRVATPADLRRLGSGR